MEKFKILYKGEKIVVNKMDNVMFSASLPIQSDENENAYQQKIENDEIGWKLSTKIVGDIGEFSNVWLRNDGSIGYNNNENEEITWLDEKIDPDKESEDPIYIKAQDIYSVVKQIFDYEKLGISAEDVGSLRKEKLVSVLKLLGYSNPKSLIENSDDFSGYMVLGRIGKELENYKNLAFVTVKEFKGFTICTADIPEGMSAEELRKMVSETREEFEKDKRFIGEQSAYLDESRGALSDFYLDMKEKVSPEDWKLYSSVVSKTAKLYLGLNYDLLTPEVAKGVEDLTSLQGNELNDRISKLIDTRDFDRACNIEDRFVIQEDERFEKRVDFLVGDDEEIRRTTPCIILNLLKDKAIRTRRQKEKYNENFNQMEELYNHAENIIIGEDNITSRNAKGKEK